LIWTVRCQNEYYLGVFTQTVHFIEQLVQKHLLAGAPKLCSFSGDQINILDDNDGRLKKTRQFEIVLQKHHLVGCNHQRRMSWKGARQVMQRMCFSSSRRTVE
jgi:hypothetical protein